MKPRTRTWWPTPVSILPSCPSPSAYPWATPADVGPAPPRSPGPARASVPAPAGSPPRRRTPGTAPSSSPAPGLAASAVGHSGKDHLLVICLFLHDRLYKYSGRCQNIFNLWLKVWIYNVILLEILVLVFFITWIGLQLIEVCFAVTSNYLSPKTCFNFHDVVNSL